MDNWTNNRIDWNNPATSTAFDSNFNRIAKLLATHNFGVGNRFPKALPEKRKKKYVNGKRLKPGESRPNPFYLQFIDLIMPLYDIVICDEIFRRLIFGAYSRKYGKPRKFRKRRLF